MDARQDRRFGNDFTFDKCDKLFFVGAADETDDAKQPELGRQVGFGYTVNTDAIILLSGLMVAHWVYPFSLETLSIVGRAYSSVKFFACPIALQKFYFFLTTAG